jgi:hypothetical protein
VLGHRLAVGDHLGQHDRVLAVEQPPDARGQVLGGDHVIPGLLGRLPAVKLLPVPCGRRRATRRDPVDIDQIRLPEVGGDLIHRDLGVRGGELAGTIVPSASGHD